MVLYRYQSSGEIQLQSSFLVLGRLKEGPNGLKSCREKKQGSCSYEGFHKAMASAIDLGHNAPAGTKMKQKTKQSSGSHSFSPDEFEELGKKELEKELQGHGWCCSSPEMREYYETAVLESIGKFVLK